MLGFLAGLPLLLAALGTLQALAALPALRRFRRRGAAMPDAPSPGAVPAAPVTALKPLHGLEPGLAGHLASLLRQRHAAPLQVVFGVRDPADPAAAVAEAALAEAAGDLSGPGGPGLSGTVVRAPAQHGPNGKVSNLINMLPAARHALLVIADADMRVPPGYLAAVTAPLADPAVGLVTCLYRGVPLDGGLASRLAAAGINWHFLPGAALGETLGLADGCYGATMALRRETLDRLGGFETLAEALADDHALGAAVRAAGLRVAVSPLLVDHMMAEPTLRALWAHELRWARTVRLVNPAGYAGMVLTHPLPLALLGLLLWPGSLSLAVVAGALAARLALAAGVAHLCGPWDVPGGRPAPGLRLLPLRDLLSFAVFLGGLFGGGVSWKGRRYRVGRDGRMVEIGA
ncbi:bacteriohopanetetrol glucosamine biosynthesis glycosyltransferase HpnI [Roseomonas sp. NAR14]|uniref:Bacteriohopanetetrol glucosamine biosynthesis glycosyltransferase HpnI n=1 Tax=Roseomonas acroporae TaxID=2937791 RepID=A0A9X1Y9Z6_9PROT|nr:bacteriohopanetetrol glucosamine biosynthesis glycosyltransferase HpnI [Roseomonas acroporae]MCK8784847.1 bacteriohopanetetrol glucosamine biosynthesis glycosyltransferase HpnI [Roseomonas acroporae]